MYRNSPSIYQPQPTTRQRTLTWDSTPMATPFGCCNFFDRCTDEIMSLHYGGRMGLLDWMNYTVNDECVKVFEYISYVRPEMSGGLGTAGYISSPCDDPNGIEFGTCKLTLEDFGRYGRMGPVRNMMSPKVYCKTDPRRRLDGSLVTDEREWDMRFAMDVLAQDLYRHAIIGNASNAGQFDGLQRWVKTGYDCSMLDSMVVDWNGNTMDGGAGITVNGVAIAATWNIIDVLLAVYRRVRQRIMWAPTLATQQMQLGDMILVMPSFMVQCLLDYYTCWSVCEGKQYNEVNLQTYEARQFRTQLQGGMFGAGTIQLDGFPIPILPYDWEMINGPTLGDMYFLTGSVGAVRLWEGEHLSAQSAAAQFGGQGYFSTDGGRILGLVETDNLCTTLKIWEHPRMYTRAPWANIRFQDVKCAGVLGPLSPDPLETSYYPLTSFEPAVCP